MTTTQTTATVPARRLSPITGLARLLFTLGAGLFVASIALQVFFVGLGVLADPTYWDLHRALGPLIGFLLLGLLGVALVARVPWGVLGQTALLFVLFVLQYIFLHAPLGMGVMELRGLHALNALALFGLGLALARRAAALLRARG
jgi:hypothetical protein